MTHPTDRERTLLESALSNFEHGRNPIGLKKLREAIELMETPPPLPANLEGKSVIPILKCDASKKGVLKVYKDAIHELMTESQHPANVASYYDLHAEFGFWEDFKKPGEMKVVKDHIVYFKIGVIKEKNV